MILSRTFSFCISFCFFFSLTSAKASTLIPEQQLIDSSTQEVEELILNFKNQFPSLIKKLSFARGVIICPNIIESSTLFNKRSQGKCTLLSRDSQNGWSSPSFYRLSEENFNVSFDKKEESKLFFFIMTQKALEAFIDQKVLLKKNKTLSILSLKGNINTSIMPDLYIAKLDQKSLKELSVFNMEISFDVLANKEYYHTSVSPMDILISMRVNNPKADKLRRILTSSF